MLNEIRGALVRKLGEVINFAWPMGGRDENGNLDFIGVDVTRLRAHFAFKIGGESKVGAVGAAPGAAVTFTAGAKILRVLSDTDCFIYMEQPAASAGADDPATDGVSMYLPLGETVFLVVPDITQAVALSFVQVSAGGTIWASVIE
jgi:hypothetical protein